MWHRTAFIDIHVRVSKQKQTHVNVLSIRVRVFQRSSKTQVWRRNTHPRVKVILFFTLRCRFLLDLIALTQLLDRFICFCIKRGIRVVVKSKRTRPQSFACFAFPCTRTYNVILTRPPLPLYAGFRLYVVAYNGKLGEFVHFCAQSPFPLPTRYLKPKQS